jgi:hypothetical protein
MNDNKYNKVNDTPQTYKNTLFIVKEDQLSQVKNNADAINMKKPEEYIENDKFIIEESYGNVSSRMGDEKEESK